MPAFQYEERKEAIRVLKALYDSIALTIKERYDSEFCEHTTPVVSNVEAEYVREKTYSLPYTVYQEAVKRCKEWLCRDEGRKGNSFHVPLFLNRSKVEITHLRHSECPLFVEGRCSIYPLRPLQCRVQELPLEALGVVEDAMRKIFVLYPQKTGFLPTQLYALFALDDLEWMVEQHQVDDAKLAMGGLKVVMQQVAS